MQESSQKIDKLLIYDKNKEELFETKRRKKMSEEKKQKLFTPENVTNFFLILTGGFIAGLFLNILRDLNAPGVAYVILLMLSAVLVFLGAAIQESYRNTKQEIRDEAIEKSTKQEKENV